MRSVSRVMGMVILVLLLTGKVAMGPGGTARAAEMARAADVAPAAAQTVDKARPADTAQAAAAAQAGETPAASAAAQTVDKAQTTDSPQKIVVEDAGFSTPESLEYYAAEDVYLVTNINGDPTAADDNGFISKLSPDGKVIALKWVDGAKEDVTLNAPKGAAVVESLLFVADLDHVQVFELPSGKQKKSIVIEGSTFLNGMTPGPDGSVFVTDSGFKAGFAASGTDAIYQVWPDGRHQLIIKDKKMGHPNGIWYDDGSLVVNTFGSGKLLRVTLSGEHSEMPTPSHGGLDGLVKLKDGRFLVSSWEASALYALSPNGTFSTFARSLDAPADIGVDTRRNRVLIPLFRKNEVVFLPID